MKLIIKLFGIIVLLFVLNDVSGFQMNTTSYSLIGIFDTAGGNVSSTSYKVEIAMGEPIGGYVSNTNYVLYLGIFRMYIY